VGRPPAPAAGSLDSQRIKTATQSDARGCDGNKKITGRQRHLGVDTLGVIIAVGVTDASTAARLGWVALLFEYCADGVKRRRKIWLEGASPAQWLAEWVRGVQQTHTIDLESTTNQAGKGLQVIPWRWAVARTFAWRRNDRRHSQDYGRLTVNSAAMMQISRIRLRLNRLAGGILQQPLK
jgi:transposase